MKKPIVTLSKSVRGPISTAILETEDDTIEICRGSGAKKTCRRAAEVLRQLADAYDKLAEEEKPFHDETHRRVSAAAHAAKPGKKGT